MAVSKQVVFSFLILTLRPWLHAQSPNDRNTPGLKEWGDKQRQWLSCDIDRIMPESETGRDFSVRLSYKKSRVAGQRVVLSSRDCDSSKSDDRFVVEDQTDSQGVVRFSDMPPGHYEISVDGLLGPSSEILVTTKTRTKVEVKMEWPAKAIAVRDLKGGFGVWGKDDVDPLASASLEVLDIRTAVPVASGISDPDGEYSFAGLPQGLYLLRANFPAEGEMEAVTYEMAVEVNSSAENEEMNWTILSRSQCVIGPQFSSHESDKELYDRVLNAFKHEQFFFGRVALAVLVNTYTDSAYEKKVDELFKDSEINTGSSLPSGDICSNSTSRVISK